MEVGRLVENINHGKADCRHHKSVYGVQESIPKWYNRVKALNFAKDFRREYEEHYQRLQDYRQLDI